MSQGKMVKFESFPLDENNKASFAFSLDRSLIPHAYILVFSFVHPANGVQEIIADGIGIRVAHSFENQVRNNLQCFHSLSSTIIGHGCLHDTFRHIYLS